MDQPEVLAAAFTAQLSSSGMLNILMPVLGIGAVVLFFLVVCGIYGLCRGERKHRVT